MDNRLDGVGRRIDTYGPSSRNTHNWLDRILFRNTVGGIDKISQSISSILVPKVC
jgi:hypothetical protein